MLKTKEEIIAWLKKYKIERYIINEDLTVNVEGNVHLSKVKLTELPVKFDTISGSFNCSYNNLTTTKGLPRIVFGCLSISDNNISILEDFPSYVSEHIFLNNNKLQSLNGLPKEINGDLICYRNRLKDLIGAPEIIHGDFNCSNNKIKTLEGSNIKVIDKAFDCANNQLKTLKGLPEKITKYINCEGNKITSLKTLMNYNCLTGGVIYSNNKLPFKNGFSITIEEIREYYLNEELTKTIKKEYKNISNVKKKIKL